MVTAFIKPGMHKNILLTTFIVMHALSVSAQTVKEKDSTVILPNDIYADFSKENYARTRDYSFIVREDKNNSIITLSYNELISIADNLFNKKEFAIAASYYTKAIDNNKEMATSADRIKIAACYAMVDNKDKAFIQLYQLVNKEKYTKLQELDSNIYLQLLHNDRRWKELIRLINKKKHH